MYYIYSDSSLISKAYTRTATHRRKSATEPAASTEMSISFVESFDDTPFSNITANRKIILKKQQ